jgi:hypothetical protein
LTDSLLDELCSIFETEKLTKIKLIQTSNQSYSEILSKILEEKSRHEIQIEEQKEYLNKEIKDAAKQVKDLH